MELVNELADNHAIGNPITKIFRETNTEKALNFLREGGREGGRKEGREGGREGNKLQRNLVD